MPHLKECTNEGDFFPPTSVFIIYTATQPQYDQISLMYIFWFNVKSCACAGVYFFQLLK